MGQVDLDKRPGIEAHYYPFDNKGTPVLLKGKYPAQIYIQSDVVDKEFSRASEKIKLSSFDVVLVNAVGGWFTYNKLAELQNYQGKPVEIEYHRQNGGYGAVITRAVPDEIKNNPDIKVLVLDDISDSDGTLASIMKDLPNATALVAVRKRDIPNRVPTNGPVEIIMEIDDVWVFGLKMNADVPGDGWPVDFGREYNSLMVKLQLPTIS